MKKDARFWQVIVLAGILLTGVSVLDFPISLSIIFATLASSIFSEYLFGTFLTLGRAPRPLSALISGLSILLLFRSTVLWTYLLVPFIAIASKYVVRSHGRHWLNPTNFAVLIGVLLLPGWLSSGQWGHLASFPLALGGLGILVVLRAGRLDSAITFLLVSAGLEWIRLLYYAYPQPFAVFLHRFSNGALWLFTFYMLTDPKTTPQQRWDRLLHASIVALGAFVLAERWYWKDTFLWSLLFAAPLVPFLDRLHDRVSTALSQTAKEEFPVKRQLARVTCLLFILLALCPVSSHAFCGFYVARADASLYNSSSQVVITRDEDKAVLTMVNNYKGDLKEFALVVPVPIVLEKEMVRVIEPKVIEHLDAYSAPRLVEYFDPDPCKVIVMEDRAFPTTMTPSPAKARREEAAALGVKIEAEYTVGEYDIIILSATESHGLETWLKQNNYNIPGGASQALAPYIRSEMKFFVAKVNLKEQARSGYTSLRPLQFAFESSRFMLPIRLGMLNADGPQDLLIYFLTKQYRVEVTNYRNPKLPSDQEVPEYIKEEFRKFYTDLFLTSTAKENHQAVFTEYAWHMGWCDPCAAEPLSQPELESLGVWWLTDSQPSGTPGIMPRRPIPGGGLPAFVTRLHVHYDAQHFPEDLTFKLTQDSSNFQGRYIIRHPWTGAVSCPAGQEYLKQLAKQQETRAQTLASLTGWDIQQIRTRMPKLAATTEQSWKERIKTLFNQ